MVDTPGRQVLPCFPNAYKRHKEQSHRFSRPPVSTAHTSLRMSVINSLPALENRRLESL